MIMLRLLSITQSEKPEKKFKATFGETTSKGENKEKMVHFGQRGSDDYTLTKNKEQRERYRARHAKEAKFYNEPTRPATLSRFILWGDSTSMRENIKMYKQKFNL